MKIRKKIGDLGKDQVRQIVQDFLDELDQGAAALLEYFAEDTNGEFEAIELDSTGKILSFTAKDGSHYIYNVKSESIDALVARVSALEESQGVDNFENIEDPEGRLQLGKDAEEKLFNYRKKDGTLVENVGIETNHLELTEQGMNDFQKALKDAGFNPGSGGDYSDKEVIELPDPTHYALLNLIVDELPTNDGVTKEGYAVYYDGLGNYFKKSCSLEIQGQSGRYFARTGGKGNYTIDFPVDIKFGSWVPQDSFHLKGCGKDVTRCMLPTAYKLAYPIMQFLKANPNRAIIDESGITTTAATGTRINDWPTDARCLPDGFPVEVYVNGEYWGLYSWQLKKHRKNYSMDKKDYTSFFLDADGGMSGSNGIWENDVPWTKIDIKGPKDLVCMDGSDFDGDHPKELMGSESVYQESFTLNEIPQGFAGGNVVVSIGANTYTILVTVSMSISDIIDAIVAENYTSSNYACYKSGNSAIFKDLSGSLNPADVTVVCTGTKPLVFNNKIISIKYNSSDKKHKGSNTTKGIIKNFSPKYLEVKALIEAGTQESIAQAKEKFNEYFDYNACMLVYIYNCTMYNIDSTDKNTLWAVYKNGKIAPMLWDLDYMYGEIWTGHKAEKPNSSMFDGQYATSLWPLKLFWQLYEAEIKETYGILREKGLIAMDIWKSVVYGWNERVGVEAYERDIDKWPDTPSYRENYTDTAHWKEIGNIFYAPNATYPLWDENTQYAIGDRCCLRLFEGVSVFMGYEAVVANSGNCPVTQFYDSFPAVGGYYNSPKRMEKWMEEQLILCDAKNEYDLENILADFTAYNSTNPQYEISCIDMSITNPNNIKPSEHIFIEGYITKHGDTISGYTYSITEGEETNRKVDKTYINAMEAIEDMASSLVDVPSADKYYLQVRAKDVIFKRK